MMQPTYLTWTLVIVGWLLYVPLLFGQALVLMNPHSQRTRDIAIGKGEQWRDKTHFKGACAGAWADALIQFPVLIAGSVGVLLGHMWGYVLWFGVALIAVYVSIHLWVSEREYVYPAWGPWAYYTFYWGGYLYWGVAVMVYVLWRLI